MKSPKRILVTGAAGSIGTTLCSAWGKNRNYILTRCDIRQRDDKKEPIEFADIRDYARMKELCLNQDILVHLAYVPQNFLGKEHCETSDIGANITLFEAARESGIQRIIFASTNHVTGVNERSFPAQLSTGDQFRPDSWYGAMKGMAEIAGRYLVDHSDMTFFSFRIGSFDGKNQAETMRTCSTLLTPRDCIQLFSRAIDYNGPERYLVTYGTSGNYSSHHMGYLDITGAINVLGYCPEDNLLEKDGHRHLSQKPS